MAIPAFADITAARRAIRAYLRTADDHLAEDTLATFEDLADSPSPVDQIVRSADLLYARRDELNDEGRNLVGGLASFAATNFWHGMATDNRGGRIAQAMERDLGRKTPNPQDGDPQPAREYIRQEQPAPAVPAAPSEG